MNTISAVEKKEKAVDYVSDEGIKVSVSYPDDVSETIRQQKINKMYDVFQPACRQCNSAATEQRKQLNDLAICRKMITVTRTLLQFSDGCAMI